MQIQVNIPNFKPAKEHEKTFANFMGVDLSHSVLDVACGSQLTRATWMENMIFDSKTHKRPPWNEVFQASGKINGCWFFKDTTGAEHIIIHAGENLYKLRDGFADNSIDTLYDILTKPTGAIISDKRSFAINDSKDKLYIFCGTYLVYNGKTGELKRVTNDSETYIPTTAIGIVASQSSIVETRTSLDELNLLSCKCKNQMIGEAQINDVAVSQDNPLTYTLDHELIVEVAEADIQKAFKITIQTASGVIPVTYNFYGLTKTIEIHESETNILIGTVSGQTLNMYVGYELNKSSNITVEYQWRYLTTPNDIDKCMFGTLFAANGGYFLFASGNPDKPNIDWHSDYSAQSSYNSFSNFTYFPELGRKTFGSSRDKIMGYSLVGDETLAIHKEANGNRDTLYLRTAEYTDAMDVLGNVIKVDGRTLKKTYFPTTPGATGEGVISGFTIDNLQNDNLFLSRNGIFGLALNNNLKSNERYALPRDGLINVNLINEANLQEASGVAYKNRYYLSVNDHCYVADSRVKNYISTDMPDTFSYEWWYWKGVSARIWFIKDGMLYFGTPYGKICRFDESTEDFADKSYKDVDAITLDIVNNVFIISEAYDSVIHALKNGDTILIKGIDNLGEEHVLTCEGVEVGERTICNFDSVTGTFQLRDYIDTDGTQVPLVIDANAYETYTAHFTLRSNVQCQFIFPITDLGTPLFEKKIMTMTVTPEKVSGGEVTVSIETKNFEKVDVLYSADLLAVVRGMNFLDLGSVDFNNFTFNTDTFITSYTRDVKLNCNYVGIAFHSENDRDCKLNSLVLTYKLGKRNKGVR